MVSIIQIKYPEHIVTVIYKLFLCKQIIKQLLNGNIILMCVLHSYSSRKGGGGRLFSNKKTANYIIAAIALQPL